MRSVAGFDLSLNSSGVAMPDGTTRIIKGLGPKYGEQQRLAYLFRQFVELLEELPADTLIAKEGTFVGRLSKGTTTLIAVHGVFAAAVELVMPGENVFEVGATTLKRWATGDGRADKEAMVDSAQWRGYQGSQHDEADAWLVRCWAQETIDVSLELDD